MITKVLPIVLTIEPRMILIFWTIVQSHYNICQFMSFTTRLPISLFHSNIGVWLKWVMKQGPTYWWSKLKLKMFKAEFVTLDEWPSCNATFWIIRLLEFWLKCQNMGIIISSNTLRIGQHRLWYLVSHK